jgi:hypothetical protein
MWQEIMFPYHGMHTLEQLDYTLTKSNGGTCNVSGTAGTCNGAPIGTSFTVTANGVSGNPQATTTRD